MRTYFSCLLLLMAMGTTAVQSQNNARDVLNRARTALGDTGAEARFRAEIYDSRGGQQSQVNGGIRLLGDRFRLEYGNSITAVYSGTELVYYDKGEKTLTYSKPSTEELAQINPFVFLTNASKAYTIEDLSSTKAGPVIGFTPRVRSGIKCFEINFSSATGLPLSVVGVFTDGTRMSIKILSIDRNRKFSDSEFKLDRKQYPKAEVIDLR